MHSKLEVLFRKMQADMVAYLEPGNDCGQDWFVNRMIWHMDGPEQREAQGEAAGASPVQPIQAGELSDEEIEAVAKPFIRSVGGYWENEPAIPDDGHVEEFARAIIAAINAKGVL